MKGFGFAIAIIVAALVATAPADAKRGKKNRATSPVEQTLAVVDDCLPSETLYWLALCPQDCWTIANEQTGSQVCCNEYGTDDGIEDGSCVTRSAR